MKLKKWIALLLTAALAARVFSACAPTVVVLQEAPKETAAPEVPAATEIHHHTDACTTNPDSCPDNAAHHTEPHHS